MKKHNRELKEAARHFVVQHGDEHNGIVTVEAVVAFMEDKFVFDESTSRQKAMEQFARSVIASLKDDDGDRMYLAPGRDGNFVDISRCYSKPSLNGAYASLSQKYQGLSRSRRKVGRQLGKINRLLTSQEKAPASLALESRDVSANA